MKTLHCPRCREQLIFAGQKDAELAGGNELYVEIYSCPKCGKLEFFTQTDGEKVAKIKCDKCGESYDADFPRCPKCGQKNDFFNK